MGLRDIDESPIAWREAGPVEGVPVLFLHGLGGSRTAWDPQLVALGGRGFRCVAWDMPGYGASGTPRDQVTFEQLSVAVLAWMDALGVDRAHLVGLSLGGMIAQHVALRYPDRLRSLALLDSSPAFGFDGLTDVETWVEQRLGPMQAGATPASIAESVVRSVMAPGTDLHIVAAAVAAMSRISAAGLAAAVRCLVTHDVRDQLHGIVAPTLVIVGEHDLETPRAYSAHLSSSIPEAQLEVIGGAGHISNLEAPDTVNAVLIDFFTERIGVLTRAVAGGSP